MLQDQHFGLYRRFSFLTFFVLASLTLQCCGLGLTQGKTDGMEVFLEIPEGEEPSLFWYGVHKKVLRWKPARGTEQVVTWENGLKADWELREGDKIEFLGTDEAGRLVITGEARVGEEKKATIPLRRVL